MQDLLKTALYHSTYGSQYQPDRRFNIRLPVEHLYVKDMKKISMCYALI